MSDIHRQAEFLRTLLESGEVHGWEDLAELTGTPEADLQWTCRRLYLDHGYSSLSIDSILEAFDFAERHNPRAKEETHTMKVSLRDKPKHQHHETNAYGFTRSGVTA